MATYLLTSYTYLPYSPCTTAKSVVGIDLPFIDKRTALLQRIFYAQALSFCYGSVRGRAARLAVSYLAVRSILRMLSPSYLTLMAAVNPQIDKETAMSNQSSHSEHSLSISVFNPNDVLLALLACY